MTDLILLDFKDLTSEGLVQILSDDKERMFGRQRLPVKKEAGKLLMLKRKKKLGRSLIRRPTRVSADPSDSG